MGNRPHWEWHALGHATEYGVVNIGNFQKVFSFSYSFWDSICVIILLHDVELLSDTIEFCIHNL